jgi:uncharacterized membrane protein HdeD (DUF308 family)
MPYTEEPIIIDRPEEPEKKEANWIIYLSMAVLAIGVLFQWMHWPFSRLLVVSGFAGITGYNTYYFFSRKRPLYAWAYFVGRLLLLAGILLYLFRLWAPTWLFFSAMICFALGMLFSSTQKENFSKNEEEKAKEEEEENLLL